MAKKAEVIKSDRIWRDGESRLHRSCGPAIESSDGRKMWYSHGVPHRHAGPAVELPDGYIGFFQRGDFVSSKMPDLEFPPEVIPDD